MKKLFVILLVAFSVSAYGQTAEKTTPIVPPPDSIAFVSKNDMEAFLKWLTENTAHAEYVKLTPESVLTLFYRWSIVEWDKKKNKKKP